MKRAKGKARNDQDKIDCRAPANECCRKECYAYLARLSLVARQTGDGLRQVALDHKVSFLESSILYWKAVESAFRWAMDLIEKAGIDATLKTIATFERPKEYPSKGRHTVDKPYPDPIFDGGPADRGNTA